MRALLAATALCAIALAQPAGANAPTCDRACLEKTLDAYLAAMVAHDPSAAPFARDARFTENTAPIALTDGLWATATGMEDYRITAADPDGGQIAYVGVAKEHDRPVLLSLRLRVMGGRITEAESVVARDVIHFRNLRQARAGWAADLPAGDTTTPTDMRAGVAGYFDGIEQSDSSLVRFDPACQRLENGLQTTDNPNLLREMMEREGGPSAPSPLPKPPAPSPVEEKPEGASGGGMLSLGCAAQFDTGAFQFISDIAPRRGLVIDKEKGIAFGLFRFNHRGLHTSYRLADGSEMADPFGGQPWSMQMAEFFKFRDGRIWLVEAIGTPLPFGAPTGWENDE